MNASNSSFKLSSCVAFPPLDHTISQNLPLLFFHSALSGIAPTVSQCFLVIVFLLFFLIMYRLI